MKLKYYFGAKKFRSMHTFSTITFSMNSFMIPHMCTIVSKMVTDLIQHLLTEQTINYAAFRSHVP